MLFCVLVIFGALVHGGSAQLGIKTHRPVSGSLTINDTVPLAPIPYQPYNVPYPIPQPRQPGSAPIPMDPLTLFLNQTRSRMASGICHTEVPTASLVLDKNHPVPAGNGSDPSLSKLQICCEGYERNVHNFHQCDPICGDGCVNGICVAPNECRCFPDSIKNIGGFCVPVCPIGCGNGDCQPDGSCRCKPGYVLEPTQKKYCIPACSQGCQNGNCTSPDVCQCNIGFENSPTGNCQAKCDNCENGRCVTPGVCQCNPGYIKKEGRCEPVCSKGCHDGICAGPEECRCRPGWTLDPTGTRCMAHCERACLNGYCSGANSCACNSGYILDTINPFMCVPHCPSGCTNGYCTAPNMCLCKPGFIKEVGVKGRQNCIPAV